MLETLTKLVNEFEKFDKTVETNTKVNEAQTKSIHEITQQLFELQERVIKAEKDFVEIGDMFFEEIVSLGEKIKKLQEEGVSIKRILNLETKLETELKVLLEQNKKLEETDKEIKADVKKLAEKVNSNDIAGAKIDEEQNKILERLSDNDLDDGVRISNLEETVEKLYEDYLKKCSDKALEKTFDYRFKNITKKIGKEILRFVSYAFILYLLKIAF